MTPRKSLGNKKQALLDTLAASRGSLLEAVRRLPTGAEDAAFLGSWSIKDLLAHLAGWDATNLEAVQQITAGRYPSFFQHYDRDWRTYNQFLVEQFGHGSLEELIRQAEESHRQLAEYLDQLDASVVGCGKAVNSKGRSVTIRNLIASEASDEQVHCAQVEAFLNSLAAPASGEQQPPGP